MRENKNKLILMSVFNIHLESNLEENFSQHLDYNPELKELYGEINTPFSFINKMLSIIPSDKFSNKHYKWLDAGSGHGNYSLCLFFILFKSLKEVIPNEEERKEHIIKNMIYMVEYNKDNIPFLREKFGNKANIIESNYLEWKSNLKFDFIIGNPPYNFNGVKKVPTKNNVNKKEDGKTIWCEFIKRNISLLTDNGIMNVLIPSIWMKPDKAGMYELLLKYDISKLHTLNANETNKTFGFHVQTPTCYFLLTKRENEGKIELFDSLKNNYETLILRENMPIPLDFLSIVNKFLKITNKYGKLNVIKTNLPRKDTQLINHFSPLFKFENVKTTKLNKEKQPYLEINYSNEPLMFHGEPKLIMAHKMYGFPYLDQEGKYGISTRDNYIIKNKSIKQLELIKEFLSTELILFLFETTRYRMRYLEKYVFEFIPDFSNIPEKILKNKKSIYDLIDIKPDEKEFIERYYKIKYNYF
jgi:hypothetical protein